MIDLELKELNSFYGTANYYSVLGVNITDGVKYLMDNGYSWFINDFLVCTKTVKELQNEEFLSVILKVDLDNKKAVMDITDGNNHILYSQKYDYTDAKRNLKLFFTDNVLLLAQEY
ncbi:MAG: hypothetical protein QXV17_14865 [Candidatus Micrarchaeaceae archaeon]